ncbi:histone chaperone ASF1 [Nematocida sp. AWRm80]|nr:histone chaperone ASF1 [Nematocida sp. AWRm80]
MIVICNIELFKDYDPKDVFKKGLRPIVRIYSEQSNAAMRIKVVYMVSESSNKYDQVLCDEVVDEIPEGIVEFELECTVPNISLIPKEYLLGQSSIVFICSYLTGAEFTRAGYFVNVTYPGIELKEEDPEEDPNEEEDPEEEDPNEEELEEKELEQPVEETNEGVQLLTPSEFAQMEIDLSQIQAELENTQLVTIFADETKDLKNISAS